MQFGGRTDSELKQAYLYYWLSNIRVQVRHQLTVHISCAYLMSYHRDKPHSAVADPQIGMTQEGG